MFPYIYIYTVCFASQFIILLWSPVNEASFRHQTGMPNPGSHGREETPEEELLDLLTCHRTEPLHAQL